MNSFLSKRNKLKFIYQKNQTQTQLINNQKLIQKNIVNKINKTPVNFLSKLTDLSFDWEVLDSMILGEQDYFYKIWEIEWSKFDVRLLSYIDIKFLTRVAGGSTLDTQSLAPDLFKTFELTDIENESSDYYKRVKMIICLSYPYPYPSSLEYIYEAKLNVLFVNPRKYI